MEAAGGKGGSLSPYKVTLFDDRLEVTSPGLLDSEITIEKMKSGLSKIRNRGTNGTRSGINSERDLNANEKTILQVLKINPRITQKDICTKTDISLRTVKRIMRELQNLGKLRREGTYGNGLWVVIDQNE